MRCLWWPGGNCAADDKRLTVATAGMEELNAKQIIREPGDSGTHGDFQLLLAISIRRGRPLLCFQD